jgi:hypothetical protein
MTKFRFQDLEILRESIETGKKEILYMQREEKYGVRSTHLTKYF